MFGYSITNCGSNLHLDQGSPVRKKWMPNKKETRQSLQKLMVEEKINFERETQEMKKASKRKSTTSYNRLLFLKSLRKP